MIFSNVKRGWRKVGRKKIYFDSRSEYIYYVYLDWLKRTKKIKDFVYHPPYFDFSQWIKFGTNRYEVDFKVVESNGRERYVEIKNTENLDKMDSKSRTRIKRLRKYFPDVELEVKSSKAVSELGKTLSLLVKLEE